MRRATSFLPTASFLLVAILATTAWAGPRIYSLERSGDLYVIDQDNLAVPIAAGEVTIPGQTISSANGFAQDPTSGTLYALVSASFGTPRDLVTIDEQGVATVVGSTGFILVSLAIDATGSVFALGGEEGGTPPGLYSISTVDGTATQVLILADTGSGEELAFNPDDGLLYRWDGPNSMESIDPVTLNVNSIALSGDPFDDTRGPHASHYLGSNQFLVVDRFRSTYTVTTAGVVSNQNVDWGHVTRGLAPGPTRPIVEDFCSFPAPLTIPQRIERDASLATPSPTDPTDCIGGPENTLWYTFTSSTTEPLRLTTRGSGYDAVLGLYTGDCETLNLLTCTSGDVIFTPTATTYTVLVGEGFPAGSGELALTLLHADAPIATSLADVGNDQGRQVRLVWDRSGEDISSSGSPVIEYGIWRKIEPGLKQSTASKPRPTRASKTFPLGNWDFVTTVPARGEFSYSAVVPTLCDSTPAGDCESTFFVSGMTADPFVFYDSAPITGASVDNLAPLAPVFVSVVPVPSGNQLSWLENAEEDLLGYRVYRGTEPNFSIEGLNPIAETGGLDYVDAAAGDPFAVYYRMTAIDFNGNESAPSAAQLVTSTEQALPTVRYALHPAAPNPFNPATTIRFEVPRASRVEVGIYDLAGRLVRRLVNEQVDAGEHSVLWEGRDASGSEVASGVYLVEMQAADFRGTERLVLLK